MVELTEQRLVIQWRIAEAIGVPRNNVTLTIFPHLEDYEGMAARLNVRIYGETLDVQEYPTTWWDAFKVRWYPEWLLKKFPPNITKLEAVALYPKISMPDEHSKTIIQKTMGRTGL